MRLKIPKKLLLFIFCLVFLVFGFAARVILFSNKKALVSTAPISAHSDSTLLTPALSVSPDEAKGVIFSLYTKGKWGIINGAGQILVEPEYCYSSVQSFDLYFLSDDPVCLTTGKLYRRNGEQVLPEYGDLTLIGGDGDSNSGHIVPDIFLYEENGLKGMVSADGIRLTEAKYDMVRSNWRGHYLITLKDGKYGTATSRGELAPPVFENFPLILGLSDDGAEVIFTCGRVNGAETIYKYGELVYYPMEDEYFDQIQGAIFIQHEDIYMSPDVTLTLVDTDFRPIYTFPRGVRFSTYNEGPDGAYSIAGLIPVEKDGLQGAADNQGNMVIPFGDYNIHYVSETGEIYTSNGFGENESKRTYWDLYVTRKIKKDGSRVFGLYEDLPDGILAAIKTCYPFTHRVWGYCVTDDSNFSEPKELYNLLSIDNLF